MHCTIDVHSHRRSPPPAFSSSCFFPHAACLVSFLLCRCIFPTALAVSVGLAVAALRLRCRALQPARHVARSIAAAAAAAAAAVFIIIAAAVVVARRRPYFVAFASAAYRLRRRRSRCLALHCSKTAAAAAAAAAAAGNRW